MEEIGRDPLGNEQGPAGKRERPGWFLYNTKKSSEERANFDLAYQMSGDKAKPLSDEAVLTQSDAFRKGILRGIKDVFRSEAEMKIRKNKREALQIFAEEYSDLKKVNDVIYNIQSKYMT